MSTETLEWLNRNTLIGFTDNRDRAWHYRASAQGDEPNHYAQAIPVEDVLRRLFAWKAIELPLMAVVPADAGTMTGMTETGEPIRHMLLEDRKAIATSDTHEILGVFKSSYKPHQYDDWLLNNVATILDDTLAISSAGLLKNRAVAWVEISMPDSIKTPEGVEFRPNLLASTSFDGSLATTYKRTITLTVCDNTLSAALGEKGQQLKIRHSKNSEVRIQDAREALNIVYDTADTFSAEIAKLTSWSVSDAQWQKLLSKMVPDGGSKRAKTTSAQRRDEINAMYSWDTRVAPWKGTAFGVIQAFNTWSQHSAPIHGKTVRAERNALDSINGKVEERDFGVLKMLQSVTS